MIQKHSFFCITALGKIPIHELIDFGINNLLTVFVAVNIDFVISEDPEYNYKEHFIKASRQI